MTSISTKPDPSQPAIKTTDHLFDNWFDPIEMGLRERVRANKPIDQPIDLAA